MTERGTVWRDENWMTSADAVFTTGGMQRGQSLIVWPSRMAATAREAWMLT